MIIEPLVAVDLFDDDSNQRVFMGEMLSYKEKKRFTQLLGENANVFAWKHVDLKGIHLFVACYHLNVKRR